MTEDRMTEQAQDAGTRPDLERTLGIGKPRPSAVRRVLRRVVLVSVALAVGAGGYLFWAGEKSGTNITYVTEQATRSDLKVLVTATGSVEPTNQVDVSSELSGTVREVFVDYNDAVSKGQVLAELDTDKLKATVDSSKAQLAAARARVKDAEATLDQSRLEFERKRALVERSVVSAQDLEIAKADFDRAQASVDSAKADVAVAAAEVKLDETNLSKAKILSPVSGIVLQRDVEPGMTVASSLQAPTLFTLAEDLTKMQVEVDVDEADVGQVKEGQSASFTVDAYPNHVFPAIIRKLRFGSETVQNVVTYKAVLETENPDLLLRPGMTATAEIVVQDLSGVVTVPNESLRFTPPVQEEASSGNLLQALMPGRPRLRPASKRTTGGAQRTIWILEDGQPKAVDVMVGPSDGRRTQIVEGDLAPGQSVIVDTTTAIR
jgi:HlyD family secretion protein